MSEQIFVSYKREDRARIEPFVNHFTGEGWSVFWDALLLPGDQWDLFIRSRLEKCQCVVVFWTNTSIYSDWVKSEAEYGRKNGILVPVNLDNCNLPMPFEQVQTAQFVGVGFDPRNHELQRILTWIRSKITSTTPNRHLPLTADELRDFARLHHLHVEFDGARERLEVLAQCMLLRERKGWAFRVASGSLLLLLRSALYEDTDDIRVDSYRVMTEKRINARGEMVLVTEGSVKMHVAGEGEAIWNVAEGRDIFETLRNCIEKDIGKLQRYVEYGTLEGLETEDIVVEGVPHCRAFVLLRDCRGKSWRTMGVSKALPDAIFMALKDAINLKIKVARSEHSSGSLVR